METVGSALICSVDAGGAPAPDSSSWFSSWTTHTHTRQSSTLSPPTGVLTSSSTDSWVRRWQSSRSLFLGNELADKWIQKELYPLSGFHEKNCTNLPLRSDN